MALHAIHRWKWFRIASQFDLNCLCFDQLKFVRGCVFLVFFFLFCCATGRKTCNISWHFLTAAQQAIDGNELHRLKTIYIYIGTTFICDGIAIYSKAFFPLQIMLWSWKLLCSQLDNTKMLIVFWLRTAMFLTLHYWCPQHIHKYCSIVLCFTHTH